MKPRKSTKVWTCRDGTKVRICDMSDTHLANTIRLLERNAESSRSECLAGLYSAAMFVQGEMAEMDVDSGIDQLESDPDYFLPEIYWNLITDAERRGLDWAKK